MTSLPGRKGNNIPTTYTVLGNEWHDKSGNKYKIHGNTLCITARDYFLDEGYSIVDYINQLPQGLTVILKINSKANELAGYNMLFNQLSVYPVNKNVVVDMTKLEFSELATFDIERLPDNVKITTLFSDLIETDVVSNYDFESWALNTSEQDFNLLLTKLTPKTARRVIVMRKIALNFYRSCPSKIKAGSNETKVNFAYQWCCNNIRYDSSAINGDGSLKWDRKDSQDPVLTYNKREGVCEGRARLLKLFLNNYYMKVPCFLVKGIFKTPSGNIPHAWNEAILDNGTVIDLDISKLARREAQSHDELNRFIESNDVPKRN